MIRFVDIVNSLLTFYDIPMVAAYKKNLSQWEVPALLTKALRICHPAA
jgi:hypothetical protein